MLYEQDTINALKCITAIRNRFVAAAETPLMNRNAVITMHAPWQAGSNISMEWISLFRITKAIALQKSPAFIFGVMAMRGEFAHNG